MDLLKQVIADAKSVKDIAKKNAISTLTEAFAPQMQSLLSRKLAEEDEDELTDPIAEVEDDDTDEMDAPDVAPEASDETPEPEMDDEDESDIDEVLRELEGSDDEEMEEPIEEAEDDVMDDKDETDPIDEIIGEVEDELASEPDEDDEDKVSMKTENAQLKRKLKEAFKVINTQKNVLNEVGVLNAKLLYTTKILSKYGSELTESQKMKILEAFDRANNLRETKLVFATISEGLNKTKTKLASSKGTASKSIRSIAKTPTIKESVTIPSNNTFVNKERWKQLAGI